MTNQQKIPPIKKSLEERQVVALEGINESLKVIIQGFIPKKLPILSDKQLEKLNEKQKRDIEKIIRKRKENVINLANINPENEWKRTNRQDDK